MASHLDAQGQQVLGIRPGDLIGGRYEIVRVLGVGGTGAVFEARHVTLGRVVAVKLLLPELAANPIVPQRFLQEARTANEVRHKNIVEVIDFGADEGGRLYMVMEFLHGESLSDLLHREAPLSPGRIIRILEPIMAALGAAHARGIVHRDVKPQNIFLQHTEGDEEPVPKLIDFGIAKRIVGDNAQLTSTGMILGTPAYMAPEQARADRTVSSAADQYALGVILYQALTGRIPYVADSFPALLIQIVSQPPIDIAQVRPDLDAGLCAVVMRMLAREPSHRYASFHDLRAALRPWRDDLTRGATVTTRSPAMGAPTQPDGTPDADTPTTQRTAPASLPSPIVPTVDVSPTIPGAPPGAPSQAPLRLAATAVAVAAVLMVGYAAWLAMHPRDVDPHALATSTTAADAGESVTLRIDVEPATAEIALDGAVVGHGHAEVLRPRDGRRLQLRLSAQGYATVSDVLVASSDARVSRVLVAMNAASPTAPQAIMPTHPRSPDLAAPRNPLAPAIPPRPGLVDPWNAPQQVQPPHDRQHPRIDPTNPF